MKCEGCEICRGREISLWMALGDILPLIEMVPVSDEQLLCFRLSADAMDVLATGPSFALENTSLAAIIQLMKALPLSAEQLVRVDLTWEVEE